MEKSLRGLEEDKLGGITMGFNVILSQDEDGTWVIKTRPVVPDGVSQSTTKDEALENVKDAIQLCLEVRAERGIPLTIETCQVDVAA